MSMFLAFSLATLATMLFLRAFKNNLPAKAVAGTALGFAGVGSSMATAGLLDVTSAVAQISGDTTSEIVLVGIAIFTLASIAMGISWIKATFFG